MSSSNKINVNYSALMCLRAEVMRKKAEIEAAKLENNGQPVFKPKEKSREKSEKKLPKSEVRDIDDLKAHTKSKLMLEAKSSLYDTLKKSRKNANPNYLVDFSNKSDSEEEDRKRKSDSETEAGDFDDDDDWVEYIDCFGRTKKCHKEDLAAMKEKDRVLGKTISKFAEEEEEEENKEEKQPRPSSPSQQAELDKMRKKWEEQMERLANKSDIHYQDVLFDEARSHGVGYYAFSQDEEQRKKQQENLTRLRKETQEKQKEAQQMRDKKLTMERNRLRAAKIRQKIRAGLPEELTEEEIAEIDAKYNLIEEPTEKEEDKQVKQEKIENEDEKIENEEEKKKNEEEKKLEKEYKNRAFQSLLEGRKTWHEMSQEEWIDQRRKIRKKEFAPKYDNFVRSDKRVVNSKEESSDEEVIGPLPPEENSILAGLRYLREEHEQQKQN